MGCYVGKDKGKSQQSNLSQKKNAEQNQVQEIKPLPQLSIETQKQQQCIINKQNEQFPDYPLKKISQDENKQQNLQLEDKVVSQNKNAYCLNDCMNEEEIDIHQFFQQKKKVEDLNGFQVDIENENEIAMQDMNISQLSIGTMRKQVTLTFEREGTVYKMDYEQENAIPENIKKLLFQNKIDNISFDIKVSMIGHQSNSHKTKAIQYAEMIALNNYDTIELQNFNHNLDSIDFSKLKFFKQFTQYRQYNYFKQRELQRRSLRDNEIEESDNIEEQLLEKIEDDNYDLSQCSREIGMLALKEAFNKKGVKLIYKHPKDQVDQDQEDMNSCATMREFYEQQIANKADQDNYEEIQKHITQTGFILDIYYQIRLDDNHEWYFERANEKKQDFAKYFKQQIVCQCDGAKEEDILILDVQKGSTVVNFMYERPIQRIQFGDQYWEQIPVKPIISELQITSDYFDPEWDMQWEDTDEEYFRGNINGEEKIYHLPVGYYGLGLNILQNGLYPEDGWFNSDTSDSTWIVLFHSTTPEATPLILQNGFKPGSRQAYAEDQCRFGRGIIDNGVYYSDNVEICEEYGNPIQIGEKVNPKTVKSPEEKPQYFICNNPKDARPYRILIKEIKPEEQVYQG